MKKQKFEFTGHPLNHPLFNEFVIAPPEKPILEEEVKYLPNWYKNTVIFPALYITAIPIYTTACALH